MVLFASFNRVPLLILALACVTAAGCTSQQETFGAVQQRAIAECEISARGVGFAACYKAFVEEHRPRRRAITAQEDKVDFFLDQRRTSS